MEIGNFSVHFGGQYKTLNLIEVSRKALKSNFDYFQNFHLEAKICPVLKSNAYGHGLRLVGKFVEEELRPTFICVDSLYEAYELEKENIKTPILILGYTFPENFRIAKKLDFSFPVYDAGTVKALARFQLGARIHLKIDSGMSRLGIRLEEARGFAEFLKDYMGKICIEGIYTHLAEADSNDSFTDGQVKTFKEVIGIFENEGFRFKWKHIVATAGAMKIFDPEFNLIRLGIGFYGLSPFGRGTKFGNELRTNLKPAMKFSSHIVQIKNINKGDRVSYEGTFVAKKPMKIGVLPLGYYDGLDRNLSNLGVVKIGDKYAKILGRVCMNLTTIDLSEVDNVEVGQPVVIYDNNHDSRNGVENASRLIDTIPYVLLTNLSETTRRVLV